MTLHPQLSQVLELYDPQRLNAILLWLNSEFKDMLTGRQIEINDWVKRAKGLTSEVKS